MQDAGNGNGLDLMLRAKLRKATIVSSVWLRKEGENTFLGKKHIEQQSGQNSMHNHGRGSWADFNPILGINLEGSKFTNVLVQRIRWRSLLGIQSMLSNYRRLPVGRNNSLPWLVGGDFNDILFENEKHGGILRDEARIEAFRRTLEGYHLEDIGYSGTCFTWERGRILENIIRERINKSVATNAWIQLFPTYSLRHLPHSFSDHYLLLIETKVGGMGKRSRMFHFEVWWVLEESYEEEIRKLWEGSLGSFQNRILTLANGLKCWAGKIKHKRGQDVKRLTRRLEELNCSERSKEFLVELVDVIVHLNMEMDKKERYWKQRARVNWLKWVIRTLISLLLRDGVLIVFEDYKGMMVL
ncbi:hypothetical protein PVK06_027104 [Gossypium arboreum]|uniref:Reverse transcriptase n=1 Tax=Gossypium arboreum TaxID=29729 RepID=A0ABR0NZG3_GOSAR|nr:hypothetical protein PVK06_027104 [Gossypium arboreum]